MGFSMELETDTGDLLQIICPDGQFGGKAIISFATTCNSYKDMHDTQSREYQWFKKLKEFAKKDIELIGNIIYSGNWSYDEEEYERFQKCEGDFHKISEEEFVKGIRALEKMWTPITTVICIVEELLDAFPEMGKEETYWFSPKDTVIDFQGLFNTLLLAKSRHCKKIRLRAL